MKLVRCQLLCGAALLISLSLTASAQDLSLATKQLEDVRLRGQNLHSLLADLALQYDIPIGFEAAMNSNDFGDTQFRTDKITLAVLLTQPTASEHSAGRFPVSISHNSAKTTP